MKKIIALASIAMLAIILIAASTATVTFKQKNTGNATHVEWTFTVDSADGYVASKVFNIDDGTYDFQSYPITIYKKTVSTYGTPIVSVYLQQANYDGTYFTLDTLQASSIAETDTMSVSQLRTVTSANLQPAFGMCRLYVECSNADINAGRVTVIFPKTN